MNLISTSTEQNREVVRQTWLTMVELLLGEVSGVERHR